MRLSTGRRALLVALTLTCGASWILAADTVVTGQHRGFTNDKLYLKLDDETELTLLVDIPGDKDQKWHKDFETLSRVTVTYHKNADGKLVATAITKADK